MFIRKTKNFFHRIFIQLFTGSDNKTLDLGRVLWAMSCIAFFSIGMYGVYTGNAIDYLGYGTGLAAILGTGAAVVGLKKRDSSGNGSV